MDGLGHGWDLGGVRTIRTVSKERTTIRGLSRGAEGQRRRLARSREIWLSYNSVVWLGSRHGGVVSPEKLEALDAAVRALAHKAAQ